MPPGDLGLGRLERLLLPLLLLACALVERRLQHLHRGGAVLVLRTLLLARHDDAGRLVRDADGRIGLVDVLAARSRSTEGVDAEVGIVDFDLDLVIEHGVHEHGGEGGMPPGLRIEGRDPDQAVDALLGPQIPVRVIAGDLDGHALDAGFLRRLQVEHLEPETAPLGPPHVHARQHLGPVLRLEPSRARMNRQHGLAVVVLALEHRTQLQQVQALLQRQDLQPPFLLEVGVLLVAKQLAQLAELLGLGPQRGPGLDPSLEAVGFVDRPAGRVGVVPEPVFRHLGVELGQPFAARGDVKDTPGVPRPAEGRREASGARRRLWPWEGSMRRMERDSAGGDELRRPETYERAGARWSGGSSSSPRMKPREHRRSNAGGILSAGC